MRKWIALWLIGLGLVGTVTWGTQAIGSVGGQIGVPSVTTVSPSPILVLDGDPLWTPTAEQFQSWVAQGVEAAAAEMYLADLPVVERWMWTFDEPAALPAGRGMQFMVMVTPELAGVVTGYAAAWDESIWEELQADRDQVISDLAVRLRQSLPQREVTFAVAVLYDSDVRLEGAVWYEGMWRYILVGNRIPVRGLVQDDLGSSALNAQWVVGYLLGRMADRPALARADDLSVRLCLWRALARRWPDQQFVLAVPSPGFSKNDIRTVIGSSETFSYVDWSRE